MYKDAQEELKRLEDALLEEEEVLPEEEEAAEEEDIDALLEQAKELMQETSDETQVFHWDPETIKNARVYNTDRMDGDLDSFSETVRDGEKQNLTGLIITAIALATGIVLVLIWWIIRFGGAFS